MARGCGAITQGFGEGKPRSATISPGHGQILPRKAGRGAAGQPQAPQADARPPLRRRTPHKNRPSPRKTRGQAGLSRPFAAFLPAPPRLQRPIPPDQASWTVFASAAASRLSGGNSHQRRQECRPQADGGVAADGRAPDPDQCAAPGRCARHGRAAGQLRGRGAGHPGRRLRRRRHHALRGRARSPRVFASYDMVRKMRASFQVLAPLLARHARGQGLAARRLRHRRAAGGAASAGAGSDGRRDRPGGRLCHRHARRAG